MIVNDYYLVGHIEEYEEVLFFADFRKFSPLFWKWINTSWIVSASMEDNTSTFWDIISQIIVTTFSIKATSGWIIISETTELIASMSKDWSVITPRWFWKIDWSSTTEFGQESRANSQGTGTGNTLGSENTAISNGVTSIGKCKGL